MHLSTDFEYAVTFAFESAVAVVFSKNEPAACKAWAKTAVFPLPVHSHAIAVCPCNIVTRSHHIPRSNAKFENDSSIIDYALFFISAFVKLSPRYSGRATNGQRTDKRVMGERVQAQSKGIA